MKNMKECWDCPYGVHRTMRVEEEGEYEPEFGRTEACSRMVTKKVLVCKLEALRCAEINECPLPKLSDEQIEELENEFDSAEGDPW